MANDQQQSTISSSSLKTSRSSYIHWIHCNLCYKQYMQKDRKFFLLACDHVCCVGCIQNVTATDVNGPETFQCPLCGRRTRACKLGNDMPPHLKELFHPEPYLDGLNTYRIMVFQEKHRKRFLEYQDRVVSAVEERKKEGVRRKEQARKSYQELQELKDERKQLEKRVIAIKHQRKELEERRQSKISNISDASSQSSESKKLPTNLPSNVKSGGITSFSHHSSNHSFIL